MEDYFSFGDIECLKSDNLAIDGAEEALNSFQRKILTGRPELEILDYVFNNLGLFVPFDRVGIAVQDGEWLRSKWVNSRISPEYLKVGYSAKISGSTLEHVLKSGKPRVIADLEHYFREHPQSLSTELILKDGMRSSLTFPLQLQDKSFGIVFFSSCMTNAYTLEHLKFLESVAQGLALVVERADLHRSEEENKNQKIMLSKVLHDLKSPLSVIISFSDLLASSVESPAVSESAKKMFSIIRNNEQVLWSLIGGLSDLASLRSNQLSIKKVPIALRKFVVETVESLRPICARKGIGLRCRIEDGCPAQWPLDPLRIRQVLENLISNAAKFSRSGDSVELQIWLHDERLFFSVEDEGEGIPEEDLSKLFREFGVANVRATAGEKGTGLGLAICKQIVKGHGGQITVSSRVDEGSCFQFWLPDSGATLFAGG